MASQTVENDPFPSFRMMRYRPFFRLSPIMTGWSPPGRYDSGHSQSSLELAKRCSALVRGVSEDGVGGGEVDAMLMEKRKLRIRSHQRMRDIR